MHHVTHMDASCHTCEGIIPGLRKCHVTQMNLSHVTHAHASCVTHVNESSHQRECLMAQVQNSHMGWLLLVGSSNIGGVATPCQLVFYRTGWVRNARGCARWTRRRILLWSNIVLPVSFAKEPYKRDYILQKRRIILRSLLIVATP